MEKANVNSNSNTDDKCTASECAIVHSIAERVAESFEVVTDSCFPFEEDSQIFDLFVRLHLSGQDRFAVELLTIIFSMLGTDEAMALLYVIGACKNDAITRQFASDFINRVRETAPTYIPKVVKEILG